MSGAFSPLSKLIIIAVMIRGRHRGLPVAIDRAIVLPQEFNKAGELGPELPPPDDPEHGLNTSQGQAQEGNGSSPAVGSMPQEQQKYE
jgi:hypothetical protein